MGSSDMDKTGKEKEAKTPSAASTQEQPSTANAANVNPDWSGFQAYSPIPPPGFLASSPQAHPYMWGVQRAIWKINEFTGQMNAYHVPACFDDLETACTTGLVK
ncbi:unnamed protein product [Dovyalis caffra]|uniref:G-box binding protein multifunctional mosaic region domain-containing protein n=1 Tax=Dovyalis caffra TaxID=77055 RepID=A0AAV1SU24_9ROSI|nr:unnamed protein product [Dovyalis caffra]